MHHPNDATIAELKSYMGTKFYSADSTTIDFLFEPVFLGAVSIVKSSYQTTYINGSAKIYPEFY
jgi:uncharacterized YccA/Bax inhibitor family protein